LNDALGRLFRHIRGDRSVQATIAIAVVVNAVLLGAWIWSRGGQTTHVHIEAHGDLFTISVDGRLQTGAKLAAPDSGSLVLTLPDTRAIPSLPSPRGIDAIRVTDVDSGQVLLTDDFSSFPGRSWRVVSGRPYDDGGVLGSDGPATIALTTPADWRNIAVDVTYRNVTTASLSIRAQSDLRGVVATVRPFHYNEDFSKWASLALGQPGATGPGARIELSRAESVKSLLASALHFYPYLALMLVVATLLVLALQFAFEDATVRNALAAVPAWAPRAAIASIALAGLSIALYFNIANASHIPYVPDSITYIFQAKMLASGHLTAPPPPVPRVFDFFEQAPPIIVRDGRWIGQYPIGHPLVLAAGLRLHALWLPPALLAGASVALIGVTARNAYGARVGVLAAALLATSPFFMMNAANFMSHNTAGFYLLASLALVSMLRPPAADRLRQLLYAAGAGLCFGLLMNTRPLSAAALVAPFGAFILWQLFRERAHWRAGMLLLGAFVALAAVMLGVYLLYNWATTGDALRSGYQESGVSFFGGTAQSGTAIGGGISGALGSGGSHSYAQGIQNERVQMALLLLVLNGWPMFVGLAFVVAPFILGARRVWDWFLLTSAICLMAVWTLYESAGVMYGPRYWYEALPFLILLGARGAERAGEVIAGWASWLRSGSGDARPDAIARVLTFGFAAVLVLSSLYGWMMSQRVTWRADFVPNQAAAMCCALGMDDRIAEAVDQQGLHDALVLVAPCSNFVCYGSVFWRNNPALDGDIVYARDIPSLRDELIAAYPGRAVYVADYNARTLVPLTPAPAAPAGGEATPAATITRSSSPAASQSAAP
jgi:4-amino-4-deoxy-L-arabinose transferase-like glycosyltransferase